MRFTLHSVRVRAHALPIRSFSPQSLRPRTLRRTQWSRIKASVDMPEDFDRDLEQSAVLIDQLVRRIGRETLVEAASNYVVGEKDLGDIFRKQAVKSAVESRLEEMNDTFLMTLESYISDAAEQAANDPGSQELLRILVELKEEVLGLLAQRLPPEMQVINLLITAQDSRKREELLRVHTKPGAEPFCPASVLEQMTNALIIDMERMPTVPDGSLLAKVCLLREEIDNLAVEANYIYSTARAPAEKTKQASSSSNSAEDDENSVSLKKLDALFEKLGSSKPKEGEVEEVPSSSSSSLNSDLRAFPAYTASFIKNLMMVGTSEARLALLTKAFQDGISNTGNSAAEQVRIVGEEGGIGSDYDESASMSAQKGVLLPGSFMEDLNTLQKQLLRSAEVGIVEVEDGVLLRLEEIRREAVLVLLDLAGEAKYSP